jgi:chromosome segregation ATPase
MTTTPKEHTGARAPIDTTKLRELLTHAQLGPCVARYNSDTHYWEVREIGVGLVAEGLTEADAALIVAAVNALGPLLSACEELRAAQELAFEKAGEAVELRETRDELDANLMASQEFGDEQHQRALRAERERDDLLTRLRKAEEHCAELVGVCKDWKDKHDAVAATRAGVIAQRDDLAARLREAEVERDRLDRSANQHRDAYSAHKSRSDGVELAYERRVAELERENARLRGEHSSEARQLEALRRLRENGGG